MTWQGREMTGWSKGTTTASYQYDINGSRISKTVNGVTTEYFAPGGQILAERTGTTGTYYLYDQNGSPEGMRRNSKTYYYLKNMEGDVLGLLEKESGDVVCRYTYDDWGRCVSVENKSGYTVGDFNPFRYRGYYLDQESGLYYVGSRYYDPEIGRWISADEISYLGINGTVTNYNLYTYCLNNPVNCIDLKGLWTVFVGVTANYTLGIGVSYSIGLAFDGNGNIEPQYSIAVPDSNIGTFCIGLADIGAGLVIQGTNQETVEDLHGLAIYGGASASIPNPVLPGAYAGIDAISFSNPNEEVKSFDGMQVTLGMGWGADAHIIIADTKPFKSHKNQHERRRGISKRRTVDEPL